MFEGQTTTATVTIAADDDLPGGVVAAAVDAGPWIDASPPSACAAVTRGGPVDVVVPLRALRWGRDEVVVRRAASTSRLGAYRAETWSPPVPVTTLPLGADFTGVDVVPRAGGTVGLHRSHRHGEGSRAGRGAGVPPGRPVAPDQLGGVVADGHAARHLDVVGPRHAGAAAARHRVRHRRERGHRRQGEQPRHGRARGRGHRRALPARRRPRAGHRPRRAHPRRASGQRVAPPAPCPGGARRRRRRGSTTASSQYASGR